MKAKLILVLVAMAALGACRNERKEAFESFARQANSDIQALRPIAIELKSLGPEQYDEYSRVALTATRILERLERRKLFYPAIKDRYRVTMPDGETDDNVDPAFETGYYLSLSRISCKPDRCEKKVCAEIFRSWFGLFTEIIESVRKGAAEEGVEIVSLMP